MSSTLESAEAEDKEFNAAIARGFAVLESFDQQHAEMTLSEVAARTGLAPATARRCLHTLDVLGYVRQHGRRFTLAARVLTLSSSYTRSSQIDELLMPEISQIADSFGDASSIAVLDGGMVLYVAHTTRQGAIRPSAAVGVRYPAHATSLGKVLLAFAAPEIRSAYLDDAPYRPLTDNTLTTRQQLADSFAEIALKGYAISRDELDYGIVSLAVAIADGDGRVVASINTSGYSGRFSSEALVETRLASLLQASRNITAKLMQFPSLGRSVLAPIMTERRQVI